MTVMQRFGLDRLTREERLDLINELRASLEDESDDLGLTPEQMADLNQRLDEDDANPDAGGITWEELKAEFRNSK